MMIIIIVIVIISYHHYACPQAAAPGATCAAGPSRSGASLGPPPLINCQPL